MGEQDRQVTSCWVTSAKLLTGDGYGQEIRLYLQNSFSSSGTVVSKDIH